MRGLCCAQPTASDVSAMILPSDIDWPSPGPWRFILVSNRWRVQNAHRLDPQDKRSVIFRLASAGRPGEPTNNPHLAGVSPNHNLHSTAAWRIGLIVL